jgi:hypothetical protein
MSETPGSEGRADEHVDRLPDDLNAVDHVAPFQFPDNSRRRIPGYIYIASGLVVAVLSTVRDDAVLLNGGLATGGIVLVVFGLVCLSSGWRMRIDEQAALERAGGAVGFAIGHASAQQVWRGLRSRPTWRVLCYSDEDPPKRRGLVLVDAIDGEVVQKLVQDADETWE